MFHGHAGGLEGLPLITWDAERFPDYRAFLDVATRVGEKLIIFASRELAEDEIEEALEQLDELELSRDERRDLETRIRGARQHLGSVCTLEIAFNCHSHLYVYEARPDWYDEFLDTCEEISAELTVGESEDPGDGTIGGFYSNN